MQRVFVLSSTQHPLMPCHPARARRLLKQNRAAVFRRYPFTIILNDRAEGDVQETQFKADPGAKTTGLALVAHFKRGLRCIWAAELTHRGQQIRDALLSRRQLRRGRRSRKTRYHQPRFDNRRQGEGLLPPSLQSRVDNIITRLKRLYRLSPISHLAMELVRFDTQQLQNPEISGVEYQQGALMGYEVRWTHKIQSNSAELPEIPLARHGMRWRKWTIGFCPIKPSALANSSRGTAVKADVPRRQIWLSKNQRKASPCAKGLSNR